MESQYPLQPGSLCCLKRLTHESWEDFEYNGERRIQIISLGEGNFVRSHIRREEIDAVTANSTFPVLEGLDYKGLKDLPVVFWDVTDIVAAKKA